MSDIYRLIEEQKARIIELENTVAKQQARLTEFETGTAREMHAEDAAPHDLLDNPLFYWVDPDWARGRICRECEAKFEPMEINEDYSYMDRAVMAAAEFVDESETTTLEQRIEELENAIKAHRDAKGHERCWLNDHELYSVLRDGKSVDFALPAKCEFLEQCEKYWNERQP